MFLTSAVALNAQSGLIHADSSTPNNSAMLDVSEITNVFPPHSLNTKQMNSLVSTAEGMYYSGSSGLSIGSRSTLRDRLYAIIYSAKVNGCGLTNKDNKDWIQKVNYPSSGKAEIVFRSGYFNAELIIVENSGANCVGNIASYNDLSKNELIGFLTMDSLGNLEVENELLPPSKGSFDMTPPAMESVVPFGLFRASSHNMTSVRIGTGYDGVAVIEYNYDKQIVNATCIGVGKSEISVTNRGAEGDITSRNSVGATTDKKDFSIIIYSE